MWSLQNIGGQQSSAAAATAGKVSFGFPNIAVTIMPKKTALVSTGYKLVSTPANTIMHTYPHKDLIMKGLMIIPHVMESG